MIVLLLTAILAFSTVTVIQLWWWIPRNGFSFLGKCVNHFGESYPCNVIDWIARAFLSVFAWPAVFLITIVCFAISISILKVVRRQKSKKQKERSGL